MVDATSLDTALIHVEGVARALLYVFTAEEQALLYPSLRTLQVFYLNTKTREEAFEKCCMDEYIMQKYVPVTFMEADGAANCAFVQYSKFSSFFPVKEDSRRSDDPEISMRTLLGDSVERPLSQVQVVKDRMLARTMFALVEYTTPEGYPIAHVFLRFLTLAMCTQA